MRRFVPTAVALTMALTSFAFTTTDVGGDRVFFHCTGQSPFNNPEGAVGTWSDEAPTGSMGSGEGGCFSLDGSLDSSEPGDANVDVVFEGTYSGAIDSFTMHMFVGSTGVGHQAEGADLNFEMRVVVDGDLVYATDIDADLFFVMSKAGDGPFPRTTLVEGTLEGLSVPAGDHDVQITITTPYLNVPTFFMYGASDADSGLSFNPDDAAGAVTKVG